MRIRLVIILSGSVALFGLDKQLHIWAFNKEKPQILGFFRAHPEGLEPPTY